MWMYGAAALWLGHAAHRMMVALQGRVLADDKPFSEYNLTENDLIVIMVTVGDRSMPLRQVMPGPRL
jgi:hypothetical protein